MGLIFFALSKKEYKLNTCVAFAIFLCIRFCFVKSRYRWLFSYSNTVKYIKVHRDHPVDNRYPPLPNGRSTPVVNSGVSKNGSLSLFNYFFHFCFRSGKSRSSSASGVTNEPMNEPLRQIAGKVSPIWTQHFPFASPQIAVIIDSFYYSLCCCWYPNIRILILLDLPCMACILLLKLETYLARYKRPKKTIKIIVSDAVLK